MRLIAIILLSFIFCQAPIANDSVVELNEDEIDVSFTLDASDPNGSSLTAIFNNPYAGTLSIDGIDAFYTPNPEYNGTDSFIYYVVNSEGFPSNQAVVSLNIASVNDSPEISDMSFTMLEDELLDLSLGAFDIDNFDESLSFSIVQYPEHGTIEERRAIAHYTYDSDDNYYGFDSFVVEVTDGIDSNEATITVEILNVNDSPISSEFNILLSDGESSTIVDFSEYIYDIDGDFLTIRTIPPSTGINLQTPLGGEFIYLAEGYSYQYTPELDFDIMLYKADDGLSAADIKMIYTFIVPFARFL